MSAMDVLAFLARYIEGAGSYVDVNVVLVFFGSWTSKWPVKVKLRVDDKGTIIHLLFAIGGNRGV